MVILKLSLAMALSSVVTGSVHAENGMASLYGGGHTAGGETAGTTRLTAVHRTLPFGTHVLVTNLGNGKTVVVRITDRGPYRRGRIIDVSRAAARELDMIDAARQGSAWSFNKARCHSAVKQDGLSRHLRFL